MNKSDTTKFNRFITSNEARIGREIERGAERTLKAKQDNYQFIRGYLQEAKIKSKKGDVQQAAEMIGQKLGAPVEIEQTRDDGGPARQLQTMLGDSSGVTIDSPAVYVQLDNDQLKHQPQNAPIGTRHASGGTKFGKFATEDWHLSNTLPVMREWADGLRDMQNGDRREHGQKQAVDDIHYEGFCLMVDDKKYVSFHCYPSRGSRLEFKKNA